MSDVKDSLKEIQAILKEYGFYNGAIDGFFGFKSYQSILSLFLKAQKQTSKHKNAALEIQKVLVKHRLYFGALDGIFGQNSIISLNNLIPVPKITEADLKKIYPKCAPGFADAINDHAKQFNVKTKADLCAFIANILHESGGFKHLRENVNYSARRLVQVFPNRFKTLSAAQAIVSRGTTAICDVIYGGRMGNGVNNGDGYKYRGGGLIHLTGKNNYELCSIAIKMPELMDDTNLITRPDVAVKSAFWFWQKNLCSRPVNYGDFERSCIIVNGGKNGLAERHALHERAWSTLF